MFSFIAFISGFDTKLYAQLPNAKQVWLYGFNVWYLCSALVCALSSAYVVTFLSGINFLAVFVGLFVLIVFLVVQAALIAIPGVHCETSTDKTKEEIKLPWARSVFIYILALAFSFPVLLSYQQLSLQLNAPATINLLSIDKISPTMTHSKMKIAGKKGALSKPPLLSVPELLRISDVYAKPIVLLAWLLGIGGFIAAPFVLRDRFYVSAYEQEVYDDNYVYVENQYQSYKLKHDLFVKVVGHPFEETLTELELIQSEAIELNSEEKKEFIGLFFESPIVEGEVL